MRPGSRVWRSDAALLTALDTVFGQAALGDARIVVRPVTAAHTGPRLTGAPTRAALRVRVLSRAGYRLNNSGLIAADDARVAVAADVAADIVTLIASGARLPGRSLSPGDVAVLVRTHRQSVQVREALTEVGVPAVLAGTSSVFDTPAARDWLAVLQAVEQPHRTTRLAAAALTSIIGWSAQQLATASDTDLEALGMRLRRWAGVLTDHGVAALLEAVTASGLAERLLRQAAGERTLTDLRHIGLAMHAAAVEEHLGIAAIADWLRRRVDEAPDDLSVERSRRLETDSEAVQILTVHSS